MHRTRTIVGALADDMPDGAVAVVGGVRRAVGGWATYAACQWTGGLEPDSEITGGSASPTDRVVYADDVEAALLRSRVGGAGGRALTAGAGRLAAALARYEDVAGIDDGGSLVAPRLTADGLRAWVEDVAGSGIGDAAEPVAASALAAATDIIARAAGFGHSQLSNGKHAPKSTRRTQKLSAAQKLKVSQVRELPSLPLLTIGYEMAARAQLRRAAALAAPGSRAAAAVDQAIAAWDAASACGCPLVAVDAAKLAEIALVVATAPSQPDSRLPDSRLPDDRQPDSRRPDDRLPVESLAYVVSAAASAAAEARAAAGDVSAAGLPPPPVPPPKRDWTESEPEPAMLSDGTAVAQLAAAVAPRAERSAAYQAAVATYLSDLADAIDAATHKITAAGTPPSGDATQWERPSSGNPAGQLEPGLAASNTNNE